MTDQAETVTDRAVRIRLLILDCDGVMTDGRIFLLPDGDETKSFDVRDGHAMVMAKRAGIPIAIISGLLLFGAAHDLLASFDPFGSKPCSMFRR